MSVQMWIDLIYYSFCEHKLRKKSFSFWHCRCCVCQKDSITTVALRAHLRVHETRQMPKDNTCEKCNKTFVGKHHVNRHMKRVHGIGMKSRTCDTFYEWKSIDHRYYFCYTVVPTRTRNLNTIVPDSNDIKSFFDMHCDVCKLQLSSLQHAKLHYLDEHNIPDGYIKVRKNHLKVLPYHILSCIRASI